jgi:hypothetical protein
MREIDVEGGANVRIVDPDETDGAVVPLAPIVVKAVLDSGSTTVEATVSIPTTADLAHLPLAVARGDAR